MALLEEITPGVLVKGLLPNGTVTIISVKRHSSIGVELVYQDANGHLGSELLYSDNMANLEIVPAGLPWSFDVDGALFRLASEAYRIRLTYLFDPLIAVHTSLIEPLPHQITAVYETMLTKQPLRYLLADDPGAGKTIMTGLLIKELMIRGDLRRCLIVAPGNLVEQWQDELSQRFSLVFDILTNDRLEASASGNAFGEMPLCIARLEVAAAQLAADAAAVSAVSPTPVQAATAMTYADAPAKTNQAVSERGGAALLEPASTTLLPVASSPSDVPGQIASTAAGEPQYHRFYGSVKINSRMMALDTGKIMEEVVKHLTTLYGANVQVTLEIQATLPGGAPESTRRTVEENCRTLRFEGFGFEEE